MNHVHSAWLVATAIAASAASSVEAQDAGGPVWAASVSASGSTAINDDRPVSDNTLGVTLGLERTAGAGVVGMSFGGATRDIELDGSAAAVTADSVFLGAYGVFPIDQVDLGLWVDYANERSDRPVQIGDLGTGELELESDFLSLGGEVSRVYGGSTRVIPALSLGWSTGETVVGLDGLGERLDEIGLSQDFSGLVGTLGATVARDMSDSVTLYAAGSFIAAQSELSAWNRSDGASRNAGVTTSGDDEAAVWGDVGVGLSAQLGEVTAALDVSTSVGADTDFLSSSVTLSRPF